MKRKDEKALRAAMASKRIVVVSISQRGGGHLKVNVERAGVEAFVFASVSASCHRSLKNLASDANRTLNSKGTEK